VRPLIMEDLKRDEAGQTSTHTESLSGTTRVHLVMLGVHSQQQLVLAVVPVPA
jgi:hypothetical protein